EKPADESEPVRSALVSDDTIGPLHRRPNPPQIESGAGCRLGIAAHDVRISTREYDDVANIEPNRLALPRDRPAISRGNQVIQNQVLSRWHDDRRKRDNTRHRRRPWRRHIDRDEYRARQLYGPQYVGERVGSHANPFCGRLSKLTGRLAKI